MVGWGGVCVITILWESVRFVVRGVVVNKLCSALTTLGIFIGVVVVIILVVVGMGLVYSV